MSLREKIKGLQDLRTEVVHVPEWDVDIEVRSMTVRERAHMMTAYTDAKGNLSIDEAYPFMTVACCYDPATGEKLFSNEDMDWLRDKNSSAIELLTLKAMELSGLGAGSVEQAEKNSPKTQRKGSSSR